MVQIKVILSLYFRSYGVHLYLNEHLKAIFAAFANMHKECCNKTVPKDLKKRRIQFLNYKKMEHI